MQEHKPALPPAVQPALRTRAGIETTPATAAEPYRAYGYTEDSDSAGLAELWHTLRRRKGTVILAGFLGALAGLLVMVPQTPIYQARTSLEIQDLNENFLNIKQVTPVSESGASITPTDIQTQIKILQSDTLLGRVTDKLRPKNPSQWSLDTGRVSIWRRAFNLPSPAPADVVSEILREVTRSLDIRAANQTRVIEILCDSTSPKLAADFANTLTTEFIEQNLEARWQMSMRTGDWLMRQLDDMRINLERSEDGLQNYARQAGLMFTQERGSVAEERLRQVQESLSRTQAERTTRQSRYEMVISCPLDDLAEVVNDPALRQTRTQINDLRRQLAELSATYTASNPRVKRLETQVQELENTFRQEASTIVARVTKDYEEAQRNESLFATEYNNHERVVNEQADKAIQYNILKREVETNRQVYQSMLQRVKESSIAAAMRASNIRVVDTAKTPQLPYKPKVRLGVALGLILGLGCGVGFVVLRERADRTIQEPGDAQFYLNITELGVIPAADLKASRRQFYYRRRSVPEKKRDDPVLPAPAPGTAGGATGAQGPSDRLELITWQHSPSLIAESFRTVLTSILFSGSNGTRPHVLVVTSAAPGEGKTTVTSNLAIGLAEIKMKVLLMDADLRKPRLHDIFDVPNDRGLTNLLEQRPLPDEALEGIIRETAVPKLFVLPSGPATAAAANLLYSANLADLIERFRREFDMILIDTPPALQMPDARIVGRLADAVVHVIRAGSTTRDAASATEQRFMEDGTRVLGVILNGWDPRTAPGGYYGYSRYGKYYKSYGGAYGYGYGHGYGPDKPAKT